MKKLLFIFILVFVSIAKADDLNNLSNNALNKIADKVTKLIPGEGPTEINLGVNTNYEPTWSILGVRSLIKMEEEKRNIFTQFSLFNTNISDDERYILNLGLGHRAMMYDDSIILGVNSFFDWDIGEAHKRGSVGFEARGSILEFHLNKYFTLSSTKIAHGIKEKSLGGIDYKLISQLPYLPWANISWTGYKLEKDLATTDIKGDKFALNMLVLPWLNIEFGLDENNSDDERFANFTFTYPPRRVHSSYIEKRVSNEIFEKRNMENMMLSKVERNNKMFIEVQGTIIITKK